MKAYLFPRVSVSMEREDIPVRMLSPSNVPDPGWRHVDREGHGHFWQGKDLPTLEWVVTGTLAAGDEYEMYEYDVGEYRCRLCGEVIEPGKKVEYGPNYVPGPTWVTVSIDGEDFVVSPEQFATSIDEWRDALRHLVLRR